uniref:Fibronectin type-III domain-containing protein n=1 Tax=Biomphalaria glabrata TaxID=6526 RepID=A0A2C9LL35_BIOGL
MMQKTDKRVHFADQCFYCLRTEDSSKLSQLLKQRKFQHFQNSLSSSPRSLTSWYPQDTSLTEDNTDTSQLSLDSVSDIPGERHAWAESIDIRKHGDRQVAPSNDIRIQDVVSEIDCETRSSVSLLESESVYLPFDVPSSPIAIRRPFTASDRSETLKKEGNINKASPLRPHTAADSRLPGFTKYDNLDQRPVRPLNQLMKGYIKPSFEMARPQTSSSEPSVSSHKDSLLPTARSQDYESSSEQTVSESESHSLNAFGDGDQTKLTGHQTTGHQPQFVGYQSQHVGQQPQSDVQSTDQVKAGYAPQDKLNYIKTIALNKKAVNQNGHKLKEKLSPSYYKRIKPSDRPHQQSRGEGDVKATRLGSPDRLEKETKEMKGKINKEKRASHQKASNSSNNFQPSDPQLGHKAATIIQSFWRGYWTREHNNHVISVRKEIRARRAEDHIILLRKDLERNRQLYEKEKRMRVLQMEAIRILYNEVQVLKSQSLSSSKDLNNSSTNYSPLTTALPSPVMIGNNDNNRASELERTCLSLQSQVSQLQETLASVSSAVFKSNSLEIPSLDLSDNSDEIQITPLKDDMNLLGKHSQDESKYWSLIPNSLSPYPSEEEESYFQQVSVPGAPTPPRCLKLQHHSNSSLMLSWKPSSRGRDAVEFEGNKHIIGYRIYVNDKLKAFICNSTSVLVEGLNSSMTYKFYVKALSGFGESLESNILMSKLAQSSERIVCTPNSDSSQDSDSEEVSKRRQRQRRHRKSPRPDSIKIYSKSSHKHSNQDSHLSQSDELPQNISDQGNLSKILTHPKLHKHRSQNKCQLNQNIQYDLSHMSDSDKQEDKKLNISPTNRDITKQTSTMSISATGDRSVTSELGESPSSPNVRLSPQRRESPPSGLVKPEHQILKKNDALKSSPATGSNEATMSEDASSKMHSISMSSTFTIEKGNSFIESINSIVEQNLGSLTFGSPSSGHKGHRRTRSRDLDKAYQEGSGAHTESDREPSSLDESVKNLMKLKKKQRSEGRLEVDGGSDSSGRSHGHRRQRSRDLNTSPKIIPDIQEEKDKKELKLDDRLENDGSSHVHSDGFSSVNRPVIDGRHRHSSGSRPSSPVVSIAASEDRPRISVAEQLMERSKLSKLKESSRTSDQMSKFESSRRSSSNESISSALGESSKRSPSADSLLESNREEVDANAESKRAGQSRKAQSVSQNLLSRDVLLPSMEALKKEMHSQKRSEDKDSDTSSKPPSDDERRSSRSRNLSESDAESLSQLPPKAPSESSSGSHSDDSRQSTKKSKHQRSPSDHWQPPTEFSQLTHSPIIMEGGVLKKSATSVRRNQSFHGLLPSKHQDAKSSATTEETSPKGEDQSNDAPVRSRGHLRSRTPSPVGSRTPILSAAQLKRYSDGGKQLSMLSGKEQ